MGEFRYFFDFIWVIHVWYYIRKFLYFCFILQISAAASAVVVVVVIVLAIGIITKSLNCCHAII